MACCGLVPAACCLLCADRLLLVLLLPLQVLLDAKASLVTRDRRGRAALDYAPAGRRDSRCWLYIALAGDVLMVLMAKKPSKTRGVL